MKKLFENNRVWAESITRDNPGYFEKLARQQKPSYLWIGCSDSRVPANQITGLVPGQIFVHRNVANVVVHSDLNCLSVMQYAVEYLKVKHIIVCGHYGCGGVQAAVQNDKLGLIDNWLRHVQDAQNKHLDVLPTEFPARVDKVCEINVIEQALSVCQTTVVQDAWSKGQNLAVHAWIYGLSDGLLKDLQMNVSGAEEMKEKYDRAIAKLV